MADLNPAISGTPLNRRHIVDFPGRLLTIEDLPGDFNAQEFWDHLISIESKVEDLMIRRMKDAYRYDPFRMRLTALSSDESRRLLEEIHELSGAGHLISKGLGPSMIRDYETNGRPERSPAGRFMFNQEAMSDPRAVLLAQSTERFDWAENRYSPAGTRYRPSVLKMAMEQLDEGIPTNGKTLIFDVETPGLNREEGIWQLSARMLHENGGIEDKTYYFDNPKMHLGLIGPEAQTLHDHLVPEGASTDYVGNMKGFLRMANQAEVVGGHNIFFDYDMLSRSLVKHEAYSKDADYKRLVDLFLNKFWNRDELKLGNVVDTSVLTRMALPNLTLAEELKGGPSPYPFSLQNILLQTDLLKRVKAKEGDDTVSEWLSRGLHYADVDVPMETHLLQALQDHLTYKRTNGEQGRKLRVGGSFLSAEERNQILRSRAIGPNIALSHEGQLVGDLRDRANAQGLIDSITPLAQNVFLQRKMVHDDGTPMLGRSFALSDDAELATRLNTFQKMFGPGSKYNLVTHSGAPNYTGRPPSLSEWRDLQAQLHEAGAPMPGLSLPERHIMSALSSYAGAPGMGHAEEFARRTMGTDILGMSRFIQPEAPRVIGKSKIVALPLQYIKDWEQSIRNNGGEAPTHLTDGGVQMFGLSPFQWETEKGGRKVDQIGLMLRLEKEDRRSLLDYLRSSAGLDNETIASVTEALEGNSSLYGIQVGTLSGRRVDGDIGHIADIFRHYQGIGADSSDQTPLAHVLFAGENLVEPTQGKAVYGAGVFIHPELMSDREVASLPQQVTKMATTYKEVAGSSRGAGAEQLFTNVIRSHGEGADAAKWIKLQRRLFKGVPIMGGLLAVGGLGYYARKKHKEKQIYAQTFQQMPIAPRAYTPPGPRYQSSSMDPTVNAGLVQGLDANKVNHSASGADQYQHLFTGYR